MARAPVVYACVYGAAHRRAGARPRPARHSGGSADRLAGGLQHGIRHGDLVGAERVRIAEGSSAHDGGGDYAEAAVALVDRAAEAATERGLAVRRGPTVTTEVLLRQPRALITS
ncbi:MAG: hypothetical protein ACRDZ4_14345 [Egibacteraceae bacterium]